MDPNELPLDPHHEEVPQGVPKMISKPMVRSAQTVHLSCSEINTISKWTDMSVHLTHITKEYHQVGPKQFLSLLHVWRNSCNYLAPRLTLSPNGLKRAFIWPTSHRSTIGECPIDLWYVQRKPHTYLALRLTLSPNGPKRVSSWPTSLRSSIGSMSKTTSDPIACTAQTVHLSFIDINSTSKLIYEPMTRSAQIMHLSCVEINTISKPT
jgi:hypothetical protein